MEVTQNFDLKLQTPPHSPSQHSNEIKFYDEFCKIFLANKILKAQLEELHNQKNNLLNRLSKAQGQHQSSSKKQHDDNNPQMSGEEKKKRVRRIASQIQRHYQCQVCQKSYGSQGSLNQHIKFKHPETFTELAPNQSGIVKSQQNKGNQQVYI